MEHRERRRRRPTFPKPRVVVVGAFCTSRTTARYRRRRCFRATHILWLLPGRFTAFAMAPPLLHLAFPTAARRGGWLAGCCRTLQEEEQHSPVAATEHPALTVGRRHHRGTAADGRVIWTPYEMKRAQCAVIELCLMSVVGSAKENEATGCCGWLALRRGSPQVCGTFPVCNERRRRRAGGEQAGTRRREWRESEAPPRSLRLLVRERGARPPVGRAIATVGERWGVKGL